MSPFEIFRRNLKPLMVFLTALALFAFVVLPAMQSYLQSGARSIDPQVAVFDGVPVTQGRVDYLTRNHQSTVRFLRELATETINRGGIPRTPGFVYDTESKTIRAIGIDERPSPLATVRTLQFASEANKSGFELDDTAIKSWLNQFTDGTMTDTEILSLLMNSTRNQMGQFHLYEQLRNQLLAELYQRGSMAGIVEGQFPIMTPAEQWANFLKINQKATIDSYGVLVNDYLDDTNALPSEAEIEVVYKDGIARYPSEQSPEPGFRRRETATFEYLVADMRAFTDREIESIDEKTLKAEYERRLKGGDFQLPDAPEEKPAEEKPAEEKPAEEKPAEEKPAEEKPAEEKPADVKPADVKPADVKPADVKPAEEKPEQTESAEPEPAADGAKPEPQEEADTGSDTGVQAADKQEMKKAEPSAAKDETPAAADASEAETTDEDETAKFREQLDSFKQELDAVRDEAQREESSAEDQSHLGRSTAVRLVAFQQDDAESDSGETAAQADGEAAEQETPAKEEADEPPKSDATADEKQPDSDEPATEQPSEAPTTEAAKSDAEPAADSAAKDDSAAKPDEAAGEKTDEKTDEQAEPRVESFEDARYRIAESLAGPPVRKKINAALVEVENTMRRYFNEKAIYDSDVDSGRAGEKPAKPDLKALADKLGMEFQLVGPHDILSISAEPISSSSVAGAQLGQRGPSFVSMMYGVQNSQSFIPKQQLYSPLRTTDNTAGRDYVSWKVVEKEGYVPDLDEVRGEVIMAIRLREARQLAHAAAETIAAKVNAGDALANIVPEDKKANLKEGLGPFSWMNSFGFQGAFLGNVPELDSVGDDFMKTVFSTDVGKAGVAANLPERAVYVVKPTAVQPHIDDLKQIFKQPQERLMALPLGSNDVRAILQGFYKSVDERTDFTYVEDEELQ